MDTQQPSILETELARALGIERRDLVEARLSVLTDADTERKKGGIAYFAGAVAKVCAHLHLDQPASLLVPTLEKKEGAECLVVTVVRPARHNPRMLFARALEGGEEIAVRVRDSSAFRAGQEIQIQMEGNIAHLHGSQPRSRHRGRATR